VGQDGRVVCLAVVVAVLPAVVPAGIDSINQCRPQFTDKN
jgi:hypothetical protein